jgi:hypothetical protein
MPSPVHESVVCPFSRGFFNATMDLPSSIQNRMNVATNEDFGGFAGTYSGSSKTPDLAIQLKNANGKREIKFVLEVGFSETYQELVDDAKLWLEGKEEVSLVMLVKFTETPSYRCPARNLGDHELEQLEFPEPADIQVTNFNSGGEYGPVTYKGLQWAGVISEAFIELWTRNPATGKATKVGRRRVSLLHT